MAKTIVGVYEDRQKALEVYQALKSSGFGGKNIDTINVEHGSADDGAGRVGVNGDLVQKLIDRGVPKPEAAAYAEGVRRGDHMIIVRTEDLRESAAVEAMAAREDHVETESTRQLEAWSLATRPARQIEAKRDEEMRADSVSAGEPSGAPADQRRGPSGEEQQLSVDEARAEAEGMVRQDAKPVDRERTIVNNVSYREAEVRHDDEPSREGSSATPSSGASSRQAPSRMAEVPDNEAAAAVAQAHLGASTHCADDQPAKSDGGEPSFDRLVGGFESHYDSQIAPRDAESSFDDYMVAYKVGHRYALDGYYRNRGFESASPRMREEVESAHGEGAWDRFKDAIRHSYETVKESLS